MLAIEALGAGVLLIWMLVGARNLLMSRTLAHGLEARCADDSLLGVRYRILLGGGRRAFVLGAFRPRIYIGDELLTLLDGDELHAVLLHEEHHRRTLGPIRAAGLGSWLTLLGRTRLVHAALVDRLADLEGDADADALRHGATPSALARALLKADPSPALGTSFAGQADQRLRTLLALANGTATTGSRALPYEWLPVVGLMVVVIACHAPMASPLG